MQAPWSEQLELLEIQKMDTKLTRLGFQEKHLPELEAIAEVEAKFVLISEKKLQIETVLSDLRRQETQLENDLAQVVSRRERQQANLDAGQASPKELLALQEELRLLGKRIKELEDQQLPVMANLEKVNSLAAQLAEKEQAGQDRLAELQAKKEAALGKIMEEREKLLAEREIHAKRVSAELLEAYDQVRERTGGVGAVKVVGTEVIGTQIEFSAVEASRIRSAKPEEVLFSEEYDYILVRCPEA